MSKSFYSECMKSEGRQAFSAESESTARYPERINRFHAFLKADTIN